MKSWFKGAFTPAARLFGIINEEPAKENKEAINKAIEQDKLKITPEAIKQAEKTEDGSSLTENEDNAILEVENSKKKLLEKKLLEKKSIEAFTAVQRDITNFREECISEAVKQFQKSVS